MKVIGVFNNKGGVGKTTLAFHLAYMFQELGLRVLAADFDPQANLTVNLLDDSKLLCMGDEIPAEQRTYSIVDAIQPILAGTGDVAEIPSTAVSDGFVLLPGDLGLSRFEDKLSDAWPRCLSNDEAAVRSTTALARVLERLGRVHASDVAIVDVGPNVGAINRAALISCDAIVVPLVADVFSLRGLRNLGPTLNEWRTQWKQRRTMNENLSNKMALPLGDMRPLGYILHQHAVRSDRPTLAYERWANRVPAAYRKYVLGDDTDSADASPATDDRNAVAVLKHYRSLMAMAHEARKPVFHLRSADGARGAHVEAVRQVRASFELLAREVLKRAGVAVA